MGKGRKNAWFETVWRHRGSGLFLEPMPQKGAVSRPVPLTMSGVAIEEHCSQQARTHHLDKR